MDTPCSARSRGRENASRNSGARWAMDVLAISMSMVLSIMLRTSTCSTGGSEIATMLHLIRKIIDSPIHLDQYNAPAFLPTIEAFLLGLLMHNGMPLSR